MKQTIAVMVGMMNVMTVASDILSHVKESSSVSPFYVVRVLQSSYSKVQISL